MEEDKEGIEEQKHRNSKERNDFETRPENTGGNAI